MNYVWIFIFKLHHNHSFSELIFMQPEPSSSPPPASKKYLELHIRIHYGWIVGFFVLALPIYFVLFLYTAFEMQANEGTGPDPETKVYQHWVASGCIEKIDQMQKRSNAWEIKRRWKHLLMLDPSYLAYNDKFILNDPICLGERLHLLAQRSIPWRYDIVDPDTQRIVLSITPRR